MSPSPTHTWAFTAMSSSLNAAKLKCDLRNCDIKVIDLKNEMKGHKDLIIPLACSNNISVTC